MYEVMLKDGEFWIAKDGKIVEMLGSFDEPITPEIIVKEANNEVQL